MEEFLSMFILIKVIVGMVVFSWIKWGEMRREEFLLKLVF